MSLLFFYLFIFDVIVIIVMVVIIWYNKIYCVLDDFFSLSQLFFLRDEEPKEEYIPGQSVEPQS